MPFEFVKIYFLLLDIWHFACYITSLMKNMPLEGPVKPQPVKIHIANLSRALNTFEPVLVNETEGEGPKWNGEYRTKPGGQESPTIHELVNIGFGAMGEIFDFMTAHEDVKKQVTVFKDDLIAAYKIAERAGVKCPSMQQTVYVLDSRRQQAIDIIENLLAATDENRERRQKAASQYITGIVPAQNSAHGLLAPLEALPSPAPDGGGAEGGNNNSAE